MATLDAHVIALDTKTGNFIWDVMAADYRKGYTLTVAPLARQERSDCRRCPAGSTAFADLWTPMMQQPAGACGASTRFPVPGKPGMNPGTETRGKPAALRPGSQVLTIRSST